MKHLFRIPVRELAGPFIGERASAKDREALARPMKTARYIQIAALVLVVLAVVFKLMGRYGFGLYLLFLALSLGMSLFAAIYAGTPQRRVGRILSQECNPGRYAVLAYEMALIEEKRTQVRQEAREINCGLQVGSIALALCYMGRWEEGSLLARRLLNCELTPLEAMNCRGVLLLYAYNRGEYQEMNDHLLELRRAAERVRGRSARRYKKEALARGENYAALAAAFWARDLEGALRLYRGMARPGETPLEKCVRSLNLGRLELELGDRDRAAEQLKYAAEHGKYMYVADIAGALLKNPENKGKELI